MSVIINAIICLLLLEGVVTLILPDTKSKQPSKLSNEANHAIKSYQNGRSGKQHPPFPEAISREWATNEMRHRAWEKFYWVSSILLGLISLGGAGAAVWISSRALTAANIQASTATKAVLLTDRPWVDADVSVTKFVIDQDQIAVSFSVLYKNVGRSPAQRVDVMPHIVVLDAENLFSPAKKDCDDIRIHPSNILGNALFPGDTLKGNLQTGIPMKDVIGYSDRVYNAVIYSWMHNFPDDLKVQQFVRFIRQGSREMTFQVVGCVSYFISGSDDVHQTAFVYNMFKIDPGKLSGHQNFDTSILGEIPPTQIKMERSFMGSFAN